MARDVREVGNAILAVARREGFALSNLPFNKIVYFAHAWYLAHYGEPLVDSGFEAWQYGPVHPQIYRQMRQYGDQVITGWLTRIDLDTGEDVPVEVKLDERAMAHIEQMTRFYGCKSAYWLVQKTHEPGAPWDQVWTAAEEKPVPGMVIPDSVTEAYYREILKRGV
ncbi:type II toxin-antitoxin system antitoxin SocA domain-containing protein [Caulobacter sp. CCNWLY153]|uniref:Panacea domain-containing protein n=1 Tax=unclassified Caulobacter TaxID=2648921 RepID=UPI002FF3D294